MAKAKSDKVKVIVKPATDNADKEGYAKANGKVIPYDIPVIISQMDLKALERQKEPRKVNSKLDPRAIMEQLQIPQEKANRIAKNNDIQNAKVKYVPKYFVKIV